MSNKKELRAQYEQRKVIGGVYRFMNSKNGKFYLQSTDDIQGTRNMFQFAQMTNSCNIPPLQRDWSEFGKDAFQLEELELLEKTETQTREEFAQDIKTLMEMWKEKLSGESQY